MTAVSHLPGGGRRALALKYVRNRCAPDEAAGDRVRRFSEVIMMRKSTWALFACGVLVGCGSEPASDAKPAMNAADSGAPAKDQPALVIAPNPADAGDKPGPAVADHPEIAKITLSKEEIEKIDGLPEGDERKFAASQKVCPVSWEPGVADEGHLGAMGVPIKKVVKGKTVFLCCKGCIKDFDADPAKYLAKLSK
jgi:hypothetical protein